MKVIALTYNYDLNKLADIGRKWAVDVYKNKDFIFEYSAACYATFVDKNPKLKLDLYTDDIDLIIKKLWKYKINADQFKFHDIRYSLSSYEDLDYSFRIAFDHIRDHSSASDYTIKIDNDMIFLDELPILTIENKDILIWKFERWVQNGNPLWGEIKAVNNGIGNGIDFPIYNMGLMGLPVEFQYEEAEEIMNKLINVDISDVTDVGSKIYHCCEQTAWNYIFYKYGYKIIETYPIVKHHFDVKARCIEDAKYLLK